MAPVCVPGIAEGHRVEVHVQTDDVGEGVHISKSVCVRQFGPYYHVGEVGIQELPPRSHRILEPLKVRESFSWRGETPVDLIVEKNAGPIPGSVVKGRIHPSTYP